MEKQYEMAINQQLRNIEINLQAIEEVNYTFFLKISYPASRLTKHLVDRLSAYYIGFNR